jgi:hypothetical protein
VTTRRRALQCAAAGAVSLLLPACRREDPADRAPFAEGALRLDLRHGIRNGVDDFELARTRAEPIWGARTQRLTEGPDWGDYRLSISDGAGTPLFRQGFDSSIDPQATAATTDVSVRFPLLRRAFHAVIAKRRAQGVFGIVWERKIDPQFSAVDRTPTTLSGRVDALVTNGDPAAKVDVAVLGDGYRDTEHAKFLSDAKRAIDYLFSVDPFRRRAADFNVHAVFPSSPESGITDPYLDVKRRTALRCHYGEGEAERTLSVGDNHALRDAAFAVPYDFLIVLANARRYGGSAHFGGPAVVAIDSAAAKYLVLHEFAHVIGGLAEEYYIPQGDGSAYGGNVEPWHPNVTLSVEQAKWRGPSGSPPKPQAWNKAEYDRYFAGYVKRYEALRARRASEAAVEKLMAEERKRQAALLAHDGPGRRVGLFEGAHGYSRGVYRSEVDCIMFSLQTERFCKACESAIERMIDWHCA